MALVSWELGLGSCWIGIYDEEKVRRLLGIPENLRVVSLLTPTLMEMPIFLSVGQLAMLDDSGDFREHY